MKETIESESDTLRALDLDILTLRPETTENSSNKEYIAGREDFGEVINSRRSSANNAHLCSFPGTFNPSDVRVVPDCYS